MPPERLRLSSVPGPPTSQVQPATQQHLRTRTFVHAFRVNTGRRRRTTHPAASRGHRVWRHGVISVVAATRDRLSLRIKACSCHAATRGRLICTRWLFGRHADCRSAHGHRTASRRAAAETRTTYRRRRRTHGCTRQCA
jgi:hypothetical protein